MANKDKLIRAERTLIGALPPKMSGPTEELWYHQQDIKDHHLNVIGQIEDAAKMTVLHEKTERVQKLETRKTDSKDRPTEQFRSKHFTTRAKTKRMIDIRL